MVAFWLGGTIYATCDDSPRRGSSFNLKFMQVGCLVLVGKDIELDAVGRQFEPYPYRRLRCIGEALVE